uniref:Uncharacterized protein n=1 Tax=Anguilla anguilla TaxID=7936 RepID=A0A0E9TDN1_ANGAN
MTVVRKYCFWKILIRNSFLELNDETSVAKLE